MKIENLCPHDTIIRISNRETIVIPRSGTVARLHWDTRYWKMVSGVPIHEKILRGVVGLPEPKTGVLYLVSNLIQEKLSEERDDLISPDRYGDGSSPKKKIMDKLMRWVC